MRLTSAVIVVATTYAVAFVSCSSDKKESPKKPAAETPTEDPEADKSPKELIVTWDAHDDDKVEKFIVYAGKSKTDEGKVLGEVEVGADDFDATKPKLKFTSKKSKILEALLGGKACLKVKAVIGEEESDASNQVCVDL